MKPWYKKWWGIIILLIFTIILIVLIAIGFFITSFIKNQSSNDALSPSVTEQLAQEYNKLIEGSGHNYWLGNPNAPIVIVEFGDYACPFCRNSFPKIREISLKHKDDIKIVFRDYPSVAQHSLALALAANCAGEQGLFWVMHDKLFLNQGVSAEAEILELAKQIGADLEEFNSCLNDRKNLIPIEKDIDDAKALGIAGTPTWFINGQKIEGDIPENIFNQIIEDLKK